MCLLVGQGIYQPKPVIQLPSVKEPISVGAIIHSAQIDLIHLEGVLFTIFE